MVGADMATDGLSLFVLGPRGMRQIDAFSTENTFASVLETDIGDEMHVQPRRINRSGADDHGVIYEALISGKGLYGDVPPPQPVDRAHFRRGVAELFADLERNHECDY